MMSKQQEGAKFRSGKLAPLVYIPKIIGPGSLIFWYLGHFLTLNSFDFSLNIIYGVMRTLYFQKNQKGLFTLSPGLGVLDRFNVPNT